MYKCLCKVFHSQAPNFEKCWEDYQWFIAERNWWWDNPHCSDFDVDNFIYVEDERFWIKTEGLEYQLHIIYHVENKPEDRKSVLDNLKKRR